jgi:hypothetical protein
MTVTVASFRANFPEFANDALYPDAQVTFWLSMATILVGPRWGSLIDFGIQMFMAHNLSLEYGAMQASAGGQAPGQVIGPLSGGSVDKVSYQRDPGAAMDPSNGHWNLTIYGLRYVRMLRMVGAGPVQVGAPTGAECWDNAAWPGPWQSIVPNPS